ncbi:uncharacterized protein EDB91DRAFT_1054830, partial [Suillus paluster]|uniref:uncharacterized protein n=1 Tax=Suillus paluster TaxID=48578 RepID=UPI001B874821
LFSRRLVIFNTSDPSCPGNSAGIAFIINKESANTMDTKMTPLIPGHTAALSLKWYNNETIKILNIYAPNNTNKHPAFWEKIKAECQKHNLGCLDFMLSDFNLTENPIDHVPARLDNKQAIEALRDFKSALQVQDVWRNTYPFQRMFTFSSNHHSLSRLDQIYVAERHNESLLDWNARISPIPTDHHMVSVRYAPPGLPHISNGRWSWPAGLLSDKSPIENIIKMGIETQTQLENLQQRDDEINTQMIWESLKKRMNELTKDTAKTHLAKINQHIRKLHNDLHKTTNSRDIDTSENTCLNRILLKKEIEHLQKKQHKNTSLRSQAQWACKGETINKY